MLADRSIFSSQFEERGNGVLKALADFATTLPELPPRMYTLSRICWETELDLDGKLLDVTPLFTSVTQKKKGKDGKMEEKQSEFLGVKKFSPHIGRNAGKAKLLTETAEYVLGLGSARAATYFQLYCQLVQQCFDATQEPTVEAVVRFLADHPASAVQGFLEQYPTNITLEKEHAIGFVVDGVEPTKLPSIQQFWSDYIDLQLGKDLPVRPCLITGEKKPIVTTKIEYKVNGVPDTLAFGASLVSFDKNSFQSFGLKQAENSPMSVDGVEKFSQALLHLINSEEHQLRVGPVLYLFWGTREFNLDLLKDPTLKDVQDLLRASQAGKKPQVETADFYVLALSGRKGRVIVRNFLQTTIAEVNQNLASWFQGQQLYGLDGNLGKPLGIYQLAAVAYRDPAKELQARILTSLTTVAMAGGQLPLDLLQLLLTRVRAQSERGPSYRQAVLIKLILNFMKVSIMPELDERMESLTPKQQIAYCCGRLMATFESIQWQALGEVGANVSDKSYAAAATTPSRIFGRLGSGAVNHLATLRKKNKGTAIALEKRLQEIYDTIPAARLPNSLSLEEQAIFDLGYWQEKAANARAAKERNEAKAESLKHSDSDSNN